VAVLRGEGRRLPAAELDLTVVMPFFNPGPQLATTVADVVAVLESTGATFEVLAVSDGSTDGSEATLGETPPKGVQLVVLPEHAGKGQAVRAGLARGRGRYLGFIDADGDVPADLLAEFLSVAEENHPDGVLGSKRHPQSEVVYPLARRLYSWGYQQLVRLLFRLDVRDTQAGIKLVRRDVLEAVLPWMVEQGFAFDLELLVIARRLGYQDFLEAPVRIGRRFTSTVSTKVVGQMLRDTFAIWWRLHVRHEYGPGTEAGDVAGDVAGASGEDVAGASGGDVAGDG
jgi:glycosyltransferase involved in cell wall biosynthesis